MITGKKRMEAGMVMVMLRCLSFIFCELHVSSVSSRCSGLCSSWSTPGGSDLVALGPHRMVVAIANDRETSPNSERIGANCTGRRNISPTSAQ